MPTKKRKIIDEDVVLSIKEIVITEGDAKTKTV